jgi:hypothetical protein
MSFPSCARRMNGLVLLLIIVMTCLERQSCEMHALKNLELAHYVDRLLDENDELRKSMG